MTQRFLKYMSAAGASVMLFLLPSCDTVLEYPDNNGIDPSPEKGTVVLNISADVSFPVLGEYEYNYSDAPANSITRPHKIAQAALPHQLRFKLKASFADDPSPYPVAVYEKTVTSDHTLDHINPITLELPPGDYRLMMWVDNVDLGSEADKYYDTSNFSEILLSDRNGHYGSNPYRDAFYGETTVSITENFNENIEAGIRLKRPMAKYTFVSDDLRDFLEEESTRVKQIESQSISKSPQLSDYQVRIIYTRYMPCAFNTYTGKPADSRTGVEYRSLPSIMDADRVTLAFDYIFTNGSETSVPVAMEVIYKDGTVVGRVPSFDVPLKRSHHTIITGKFLTTKSNGDIGVNPDFNGDFNIEIK